MRKKAGLSASDAVCDVRSRGVADNRTLPPRGQVRGRPTATRADDDLTYSAEAGRGLSLALVPLQRHGVDTPTELTAHIC